MAPDPAFRMVISARHSAYCESYPSDYHLARRVGARFAPPAEASTNGGTAETDSVSGLGSGRYFFVRARERWGRFVASPNDRTHRILACAAEARLCRTWGQDERS